MLFQFLSVELIPKKTWNGLAQALARAISPFLIIMPATVLAIRIKRNSLNKSLQEKQHLLDEEDPIKNYGVINDENSSDEPDNFLMVP